jgi:uncharacterized membrane protein
MTPEEAIAHLTRRVYQLEQEVAELRTRDGVPAAARPKVVPPSRATRPLAEPEQRTTPAVRRPSDGVLEANVVGTWFARVGMLAILIGSGFAFKYAVDRGIIGPSARVAIGLAVGLAFVAWGEVVFRRGWELFAQAVTGGGIALWYLSILSALHVFDLMSPGAAFAVLLVVTSVGAALAFRQDSIALAVVALVGGFLNPFLVGADQLDPLTFLAYVVALDVFVLIVAGRRWEPLDRVALVGTIAVVLAVTSDMSFSQRVGFSTVVFAVFAMLPFLRETLARDDEEPRAASPDVLIGATAGYFAYMLWVLSAQHDSWRGLFTAALAALFVGGAYTARAMRLRFDAVWMTSTAVVLMALFVPIQFRDAQIGAAWAVEGLIVMVFLVRFGQEDRLSSVAGALMGLGTLALFGALADGYPPDRLIATWASLFAGVVLVCLVAAALVQPRIPAAAAKAIPDYVWLLAANAVALVWMSQEVAAEIERSLVAPDQAVQFALTSLWAVYGAALLSAGFAARARWARLAGVALLAITVGKLALYDLWLLRTSYRIIAFVGLGVILLVCSVLYQRFRDLIAGDDDEPALPAAPPPPPPAGAAKAPSARKPTTAKKAPARKAKPRPGRA